ncbi:MAG: HAMP domain-containing histidine kinase [Lachnospiraceae bacterium]|nr:HAMP domain-containing histidine kinase [Lachnospiraceae bacterium]
MKLRYFVIAYTLLMAGIWLFMGRSLREEEPPKRDLIFYNRQLKAVEQALSQNMGQKEIEQRYGCEVLYFHDNDDQLRYCDLFREGAVFLDLSIDGELVGKLAWNETWEDGQKKYASMLERTALIWGAALMAGYLLIGLLYIYVVRPFRRLQKFSMQIAKGNLDFPLPIEKYNFFGAYTESFDIMREELKKAREGEYQANQSKKELVAQLSHDIKTPLAAIKAACEVLQLKEQSPYTREKLTVIENKANTADHLAGNMFHAALEDLTVLKVEATAESSLFIEKLISDLKFYGEISCVGKIPECLLWMDKLRLEQAVDNIINNSYKYAGTQITVTFREQDNGVMIRIRDEGPGMPEEEIASVTEKFYRGSNAKGKAGSGLGLYLSRIFLEQMGGGLECYNQNGFVVELFLRKV